MTGLDEYNNRNLQKILNYIEKHPKVKGFYYYLKTDKSLTSIYKYLLCVQNMLDYTGKDPSELCLDDYTEYLAHISFKPDGTPNTSSFVIQRYHALKNYGAYLLENEIATKNYMLSVKRPRAIESQTTIEKREKSFLTKEEIKLYIKAVWNGVGNSYSKCYQERSRHRDLAIIMIFLTTGIRVSALVNLDIQNIDFNKQTLWVTDKGRKVKAYKLNKNVISILKMWLSERNHFAPVIATDALFISTQGERLKHRGVTDVVMKYAININGKHITPHKLRATYGTQLYEATKDIYFVQRAMGHSSPTTTERYVRGQNDVTKEASDIMGNLF